MRRLLGALLFLVSMVAAVALTRAGRLRDVYRTVCDLTSERFYKSDERLDTWVRQCRILAARWPLLSSVDELMAGVQDHMNTLSVSHFAVYSPVEDRKLWTGESVDTGIRSRYVEDRLVVFKVFSGSAGEEAGVRAGDEILELPGIEQVTPWGAEHRSGEFRLRRRSREFRANIKPRELQVDSSPQVENLGGGAGLLTISSFRSEYFGEEEWRRLANRLNAYRHLIVDVRENSGGNFVAMLRAFSTFACSETEMGRIVQPRKTAPVKDGFDDDTRDDYQIKELAKFRVIGLKTFSKYGCFRGRATVLMGPDTSSVAEVFADGFKRLPRTRVWGQPSAGDVVLAVWYDLRELGPGFSFSIPEAVYLNRAQQDLEGAGVYPQRELHYQLGDALKGLDTWVETARRN